jgi:hypothetical protein
MIKPFTTTLLLTVLLSITTVVRAQSQPQQTDNIVIILDASGSMNNIMPGTPRSKMQTAKDALTKVLNNIPASTQVGLLVFSGRNKSNDWLQPLGPMNQSRLNETLQALARLTPDGSTPLGKYLKIGADRLLEQRKKQLNFGTCTLLIVTDGQATDMALVNGHTPDILSRGIRMDVIGVAMDDDHSLAHKVHRYRRADNPEALDQAIAQTMAEVGSRSTDGNSDDESFSLIKALPDGIPQAVIKSLTTYNDKPIHFTHGNATNAAQPAPKPTPVNGATPRPMPVTTTHQTNTRFSWVMTLFVVIIIINVLKTIFRKARS